MRRRRFLLGALGVAGAGVAALGARSWQEGVFSAGQGAAYEPWATWRGRPDEGARAVVRAAILAANPHNSQPWRFHVDGARIDVHADPSRSLGPIDPFLREMYIGLGCALENLVLGAEGHGYASGVALMPDAARREHVATVAGFGVLVVREAGDPVQRLRGGRAWQRMHLRATLLGLALQSMNQPTERWDREVSTGARPEFGDALRAVVGDAGGHALMTFRFGYPTAPAGPSPRRDLADVLA
jgi:nitroreductase